MSAEARADLLLGSPSGQLLLAGCLGREFGHTLTGLRWQKAAPEEVRAATRAVVAHGEWLGLLDFDEFGLLAAVARAHPGFGGGIAADAGTLALLALARDELRPVAGALVSAPPVVGTGGAGGPAVPGMGRLAPADRAGGPMGGPGQHDGGTRGERTRSAVGTAARRPSPRLLVVGTGVRRAEHDHGRVR